MAKKQTRRSISVSRTTYERLKAFCETNNISMSQLVETRVNDFLGDAPAAVATSQSVLGSASGTLVSAPGVPRPMPPRPSIVSPASNVAPSRPSESRPSPPVHASPPGPVPPAASSAAPPPMTSAAARFAVDPPPPIIKPRQETAAPKPAEKRPEQIFTF